MSIEAYYRKEPIGESSPVNFVQGGRGIRWHGSYDGEKSWMIYSCYELCILYVIIINDRYAS